MATSYVPPADGFGTGKTSPFFRHTQPFPVAVWHFQGSRVRSKVFLQRWEILEANRVDKRWVLDSTGEKNFLLTLSYARLYASWDGRDQTPSNESKTSKKRSLLTSISKTFRFLIPQISPERDFPTESIMSGENCGRKTLWYKRLIYTLVNEMQHHHNRTFVAFCKDKSS